MSTDTPAFSLRSDKIDLRGASVVCNKCVKTSFSVQIAHGYRVRVGIAKTLSTVSEIPEPVIDPDSAWSRLICNKGIQELISVEVAKEYVACLVCGSEIFWWKKLTWRCRIVKRKRRYPASANCNEDIGISVAIEISQLKPKCCTIYIERIFPGKDS